ncbi:hypothetical protein AB0383_38815 [Amycolatopsis sp. NPDC051373]|uniref:hypothetical protein n=1 Tax=Amycolatopsis sp. NPDC051373 TaxID=3155801 RepID=UPI00344FE9DB
MLRKTVVLAGLVVLLAGCSSGAVESAPGSSATKPSPTSSHSPKPKPKPPDLSQFLPTDEALAPTGFALDDEVRSVINAVYPKKLMAACGRKTLEAWDQAEVEGNSAGFFKLGAGPDPGLTSEVVDERMGRYDGMTGAQVITKLKSALACGTFTDSAVDFRIDGAFDAPTLPGVDSQYGFCATQTDDDESHRCVLLLSHGDRVESLQSVEFDNGNLPAGTAKEAVRSTLPMFAAAFTKDR